MTARTGTRPAKRRSRGRPTPEDAVRLEERLLSIALEEFLEHGYGAASMSRIVAAAGVSKTTLYSRYPSKEALFRAIVSRQVGSLEPALVLQSQGRWLDLESGLRAYANHMLALSLQRETLGVNRLLYSESSRFPELGLAAAERNELGVQRITDFLRARAAEDGLACADARSVAELFILMIRGWYINVLLTNRTVTDDEREQWVARAVHILVSGREQW